MNRNIANRWIRAQAGREAHQSGQALILAVICLLVLCLGLLAVFDTGQVVNKKEQLTNAADAAAYSVGIEQARALNTVAYFNRAEVANQIAIAQIVSIQSYANYADSMAGRTANILWDAGEVLDCCYIGEVVQVIASTIKDMQEGYAGILSGVDEGESAIVTAMNGLNEAYSLGQSSIVYAFSVNGGLVTANKVVHDNTLDPGGVSHAKIAPAGAVLLYAQLACFDKKAICAGIPALKGNSGYTVRYTIPQASSASDNPGRTWAADRVASVMMRARDLFSASRNGHFPISPIPLFKIDAVKRGGTDLVDYNRWVAADAMGFSLKIGFCSGWFDFACFKKNGILGIGAAAAMSSRMAGSSRSNPSPVIKPGVTLTKASGGPSHYRGGLQPGWYSPYADSTYDPYQGALDFASDADLAAHPTDQKTSDPIADLKYLTPWQDIVPRFATPYDVAWIKSFAPGVRIPLIGASHPSGLQDYNDVAPGKAVEPYRSSDGDDSDIGPIFTVYVHQKDKTVRTGANIGMEGGDLKLKNKGAGKAMGAMSSAQVYYDRPWWNLPFLGRHTYSPGDRDNNQMRELGNLFEPYWQVRLVETPGPIKVALLGSQLAGL
ncbi:MAG TPA: pilus assembly protein TadG-related protein [Rhodanobacteraceae bacterium]